MTAERIACVGGGPGGLFFAALAKSADPSREVTVFERNRAEDTFGFGVVFSDSTMAAIDDADPVLRTALAEHGVRWDPIEVRLKGERIRCGGNGMAAVVRTTLLSLLRARALRSGVKIRYETPVRPADVLDGDWDLVVASDGANSTIRTAYADRFEPTVDVATAKFIWFGTTYPFGGLTFVHEHGPDGTFAVHGYPIAGGTSTFIVETDERSWRAAGLDEFDVTAPPGPSDEKSRDYLTKLFAEQIDGHPLLINNSRWGNFRTIRARTWHFQADNGPAIVLLGDAAHTAHFSVGSGTKMAMEDAVSLAEALHEHDRLDDALAAHAAFRQPQVAKIQDSARPSLSWWEHFGRYHAALEPWQFAYHFLTRSLTDHKLSTRDSDFVDGIHARWRERHGAEPLASPVEVAGGRALTRAVVVRTETDGGVVELAETALSLRPTGPAEAGRWGVLINAPDQESELPVAYAALADGLHAGAGLAAVTGGTELTRRLISEQARLLHGAPSLHVVEPGTSMDVATTDILSGRADLVGADAATVASWTR